MKKKKMTDHELEDQINVRAWKDPEFKKKLLANPRGALETMGFRDIPERVKVRVEEEDKNEMVIVLRTRPELSESDLKEVQGGCSAWQNPTDCNRREDGRCDLPTR
jgi:hypothetical protein